MRNILISSKPIPSNKIGSWNILLTNLIEKEIFFFDAIISPKPHLIIDDINHIVKEESALLTKIKLRFLNDLPKKEYWSKLKKIIDFKKKVNIIIFDDIKILEAINFYSLRAGLRENLNIIYFNRGYRFDLNVNHRNRIFKCIDKLVVQTESSYLDQVKENHTIPCEVRVLRNGIDSDIFFPKTGKEKLKLKEELNLNIDKKYFLWISQDRPKKGLSIILKAWSKIIEKFDNVELLILGTNNEIKGENIRWFGRKSNKELAKYYQVTDYYLFSSLCHEGHPLSLTEALKSGAKCIASNIDPISEILHGGDLGLLVENPHFVESWITVIERVLINDINFNKASVNLMELYNMNNWKNEFRNIINK